MVSEDESDLLFKKHADLCNKLNLDGKCISESWESFQELNKNYTLEGEPLHWLGCAIFVACRKSITPTVGHATIEGNCVNLTSLLRYCDLNLTQFFCNIKKWADMVNMPEDFRHKVNYLEDTFAVTCNIFKEYCNIYIKVFKSPEVEIEPKHHRNRKQRQLQCTSAKVFEFTWNLFLIIRGHDDDSSYYNDLVQSYHLLLAVCDLVFKNAFLAGRKDLLNSSFEALPENWLSADVESLEEAPCIIGVISKYKDTVDAKYIKHYQFKKTFGDLIRNETLQGNAKFFTGLFDASAFDSNLKSIARVYENHLLNKGGFDERIFLAEYRRRVLERQHNLQNTWTPNSIQMNASDTLAESPGTTHNFGTVSMKSFETPLTGRVYLNSRERQDVTGLNSATQVISLLQVLLNGRKPQPSDDLLNIFNKCNTSPADRIKEIVSKLGHKFVNGFVQNSLRTEQVEFAKNRLHTITTLFYKLIEGILIHEKTINSDLSSLVHRNLFYECVFACSVEIVLHAYNLDRKLAFPWTLRVLEIEACDFLKVIELIVRSKDPFHRDTIKHLSKIEETILESLAWKSDSKLWDMIEQQRTVAGDRGVAGIPKLEDIALLSQLMYSRTSGVEQIQGEYNGEGGSDGETGGGESNEEMVSTPGGIMSPSPPSAIDRFQSPVNNHVNRQLFPVNQSSQSVLQKHTHLMLTDKGGNKRLIPIVVDSENGRPSQQQQHEEEEEDGSFQESKLMDVFSSIRPRRTGSLAIFFRKFYNLAGVRMEHLCNEMNIADDIDLKRKIWTIFEHSICNHADRLLKDRHLDQLLMCSVYVVFKVSGREHTFTEVMKCYRQQPQADSNIYRNVLIERKKIEIVDGEEIEVPEKTKDLIYFYNSLYIALMRSFAVKFATSSDQGAADLLLSPLPRPTVNRRTVNPPIEIMGNVFVRSLDNSPVQPPPGKSFNYIFSRSPSKDLKDINKAINSNGISGKRILAENDADLAASKRICNRKVQSLLEERKTQNVELTKIITN